MRSVLYLLQVSLAGYVDVDGVIVIHCYDISRESTCGHFHYHVIVESSSRLTRIGESAGHATPIYQVSCALPEIPRFFIVTPSPPPRPRQTFTFIHHRIPGVSLIKEYFNNHLQFTCYHQSVFNLFTLFKKIVHKKFHPFVI